jgi:uncharacterized protein YjbI with pentapeptide repeats
MSQICVGTTSLEPTSPAPTWFVQIRSSIFKRVAFVNANLEGADLRQSSFIDCNFERATMRGAVLTLEQSRTLHLSKAQTLVVDWRKDGGPEPDGG